MGAQAVHTLFPSSVLRIAPAPRQTHQGVTPVSRCSADSAGVPQHWAWRSCALTGEDHKRRRPVPCPFPGMDPYLEHPTLWPGVHNGLIAALQLALAPQLRPRYYIALEERVYVTEPAQRAFVGRPDLAVVGHPEAASAL